MQLSLPSLAPISWYKDGTMASVLLLGGSPNRLKGSTFGSDPGSLPRPLRLAAVFGPRKGRKVCLAPFPCPVWSGKSLRVRRAAGTGDASVLLVQASCLAATGNRRPWQSADAARF